MGTSKGMTMRSLAPGERHTSTVDPVRRTEWNPNKWTEFISGSELEELSVHKYYLGKAPPRFGVSTDVDASKVATELFQDMVSVGAIVLPKWCEADDFVFSVCVDAGSSNTSPGMIISRKGKLGKQEKFVRT